MYFLQSDAIPVKLPEIPADSVVVNRITEDLRKISQMTPHEFWEWFLEGAVRLGLKIAGALLIFLIGRWIIRMADQAFRKLFAARRIDPSVSFFIRNIIKAVNYTIICMVMVHILGITTSWFMAFLAAAGFAIGMALSGTLQNFAGGVMILIMKPYRIGDYVSTQGYEGTVQQIRFFSTILLTGDNQRIIIPNGSVSSNIINNVSVERKRRVEWVYSISYGSDFHKAKALLARFIKEDTRILEEPEPEIAIKDITTSSIDIIARAWTYYPDFSDVYFALNEKVYESFPGEGLGAPIQRIDINMLNPDTDTKTIPQN